MVQEVDLLAFAIIERLKDKARERLLRLQLQLSRDIIEGIVGNIVSRYEKRLNKKKLQGVIHEDSLIDFENNCINNIMERNLLFFLQAAFQAVQFHRQ